MENYRNIVVKCDVDNILNNLVECMFEMYFQRTGMQIKYEQCVEYDFSCFPSDICADLYKMFDDKEMWDKCRPKQNTLSYLKKMNEEFDLIIVTATNTNNFQWKVEWIKRFFPFIKEEQIWRDDGKHRCRIWSDFSIDDYHENLKNDLGYRILISAPWNMEAREHYDFRADSLKEAYAYIKKSLKEGIV